MAITANDIKYYYTGSSSNSGGTSLGGTISSNVVSEGLEGLFDNIGGYESLTGSTEYRCIAIKNTNATEPMINSKVFISQNTEGDDSIEIAVEVPSSNQVQSIANINTAPTGVVFSTPDSDHGITCTSESSLLGYLDPGKWIAVWIKRVVPAGSKTFLDNTFKININGDIYV